MGENGTQPGLCSGVQWIEPRWSKGSVRGLFSLRHGGFSKAPFDTLNMGLHVGDEEYLVIRNRQTISRAMNVSLDDWVAGTQVHGAEVFRVERAHRGAGSRSEADAIPGVDGLMTNERGIVLSVFAADCVPILFYDKTRQVIATAHSGWKGTAEHIVIRVVEAMKSQYACRAQDIQIALGPSIRRCCYEVDNRVIEPMANIFGRHVFTPRVHRPQHALLSLQDAIRQDALKVGILPRNIEDTGICTSCRSDEVFSHRKDGGRTGRLVGILTLLDRCHTAN